MSVAFSGRTVAVSIVFSPMTSSSLFLSSVIESTGMGMTSIRQWALIASLETDVAVILTLPIPWVVTRPSSTEAMLLSDEDQEILLSVASSGLMVALSSTVSPMKASSISLSSEMSVTSIGVTVTVTLSDLPPLTAVTVMTASPRPTAFTVPSVTVATASLDEDQVTVVRASSGETE